VLKMELYRNLALAAVCVFIVTLVLIANLWTSVLVFVCVIFTVVRTRMLALLITPVDVYIA